MITDLVRELHVSTQFGLSEALRDLEMSLDEYYALVVLERALNPLKMTELAARVLRDASAATRIVDSLQRRGLCRRASHDSDRRARYVSITRAGRGDLARAERMARSIELATVQKLTNQDRQELTRILRRLLNKSEAKT